MTTKQLGIDLVSDGEDGNPTAKYHVRLIQEGDSPDLELRLFKDCGPLMHVDAIPAEQFLSGLGSRRLFRERTGVSFSVEMFSILRDWVRMYWEMTR